MSYLHIENLRKADQILQFKTCYALEKIHGTSAHVAWRDGQVVFFSGGEKHERFKALFDEAALAAKFAEKFLPTQTVVVYGEAYGGKQQGMSATYGKELKFVVFEVRVGDSWLAVPKAEECALSLGFEFVFYQEIPALIEHVNVERDRPSTQAVRNGITESRISEGVVLRPPFEVTLNNGSRLIAKHKREEFSERGRPAIDDMDPTKRELMENAAAIAEEWVTPMRLVHVLDRLISARDNKEVETKDIPAIVTLMLEDVGREGAGEYVDSTAVRKAISGRTVFLFKSQLKTALV